jgi:ADP-ribose pyrophosphatase YjhB (NUDIX family)
MAAGALFVDEAGRVLIVQPVYKESWDIPGGYVEPGESPRQACIREVREELGITPPIGRLLVVDWAPSDGEGDKILFVFAGGRLDAATAQQITLDDAEVRAYRYRGLHEIHGLMTDRLVRRITSAANVYDVGGVTYLEHGQLPE